MREVGTNPEGLAELNGLQPSGHSRQRSDPFQDAFDLNVNLTCSSEGAQTVVHVELPSQPARDVEAIDAERYTRAGHTHIVSSVARPFAKPERHRRDDHLLGQTSTLGGVPVDHGTDGKAWGEQPGLGPEV